MIDSFNCLKHDCVKEELRKVELEKRDGRQ